MCSIKVPQSIRQVPAPKLRACSYPKCKNKLRGLEGSLFGWYDEHICSTECSYHFARYKLRRVKVEEGGEVSVKEEDLNMAGEIALGRHRGLITAYSKHPSKVSSKRGRTTE